MKKDWFLNQKEEVVLQYEEKAVKDHAYFVHVKTQNFISAAKKYLGSLAGKRCLDIGCGTGETTALLSREFQNVVGLDYVAGMLKRGAERVRDANNACFVAGDASCIPLKDESFDAVVLFNIIHHVPSKEILFKIFAQLKRITRDGGIIAVVELNPYNPVSRNVIKTCEIDEGVYLDGFDKGLFPTTLFPRQCELLFKQAGMQVTEIAYFVFFPKALRIFLPVERLLKQVPFGGLYMIVGRK